MRRLRQGFVRDRIIRPGLGLELCNRGGESVGPFELRPEPGGADAYRTLGVGASFNGAFRAL